MKRFLSHFQDEPRLSSDGGKGYNLKRLIQLGLRVPKGIILSADFYKTYFNLSLPDFSSYSKEDLQKVCEDLRQQIVSQSLPQELVEAINEQIDPNGRYAVRSSSIYEDLGDKAFAGLHDTYLNVEPNDLESKIIACLASLWNMEAIHYREEAGIEQQDATMAVVIQEMVPAETSGVVFSIEPITGHFDTVLIEASHGLGEVVVSGEHLTDSWKVNVKTLKIEPIHQTEKPSLVEEQLIQLAKKAKEIENLYQEPLDIEWAFYQNELYILQARPQTFVPPYFTLDESYERYPDPISPLTWAFVDEAFHESLDYSLQLMGIHLPTRPWFALKDGYVYGNQNAVKLLAMKRPLKLTSLEDLQYFDDRYYWAEELIRDWDNNLNEYLIGIGRLGDVPTPDKSVQTFLKYFYRLFEVAKNYFLPNIAISMTQGFLAATCYEALYFLYGNPSAANEVLQSLLTLADLKTTKINHDLSNIKDFSDKSASFQQFLKYYGHRETTFDYYHPTWAENPEVLKNMGLKQISYYKNQGKEKSLIVLKDVLERTPGHLWHSMYHLIQLLIKYTELDDYEHFQTTRVNLLARKGAGNLGKKVGLKDPYDVFFMTMDEFKSLRDEQAIKPSFKDELAKRRQHYFELYDQKPSWNYNEPNEEVDDTHHQDQNIVRGIPGSPGKVEGKIFIVRGIEDFNKVPEGAILVTKTTNPSWTPLFYQAKGLITEAGGALSHGAVTAREVGIPAIMSVKGAMGIFSNGDTVMLDGTNGTITRK